MYINLTRVEFVITYNCSGKCKHCSVGGKASDIKGHIEYDKIKGVLTNLSKMFEIQSVMCFGGEPLLYYHEVEGIMKEAYASGVLKRQIITNGYFSKDKNIVANAVALLESAEVTDILLSVDSFHQEYIPLDMVNEFANQVTQNSHMNIRIHPAWVKDSEDDNIWNRGTKEIIHKFEELGIKASSGNNIFPAGNAIKNLTEFYEKRTIDFEFRCGQAEYTPKLDDVNTIVIMPNGDVCVCCFTIGNIYEEDIITIIQRYHPYDHPLMKILMEDGVKGLLEYAEKNEIKCDVSNHYSACGVCRDIVGKVNKKRKHR